MKVPAYVAVAAGLLALAACSSPTEKAEDNVEAGLENQADMLEEQADNAVNEMQEDALENQADALEEQADNMGDAVENGSASANNAM